MAGNKYISNNAGTLTEVAGIQASGGAADAGKLPALDATGRLDPTMMPVGVASPSAAITASEALGTGAWVNIWNNAGAFNARLADGSTSGKEAHGFVLAAAAANTPAQVYFPGEENTQVTGQTPGPVWLSDVTPGAGQATPPSGGGKTVQRLGIAVSPTEVIFQPTAPIVLA